MYEALGDIRMRSFITNFYRIIDMCKKFAGNRVNNLGNIPRRGVAPQMLSSPEFISWEMEVP